MCRVKDSEPNEIDLHGLYAKEAIAHTDRAIEEAKRRGDSYVNLIHSPGGVAKLKSAIEELRRYPYSLPSWFSL
jgi:hypothetical protein